MYHLNSNVVFLNERNGNLLLRNNDTGKYKKISKKDMDFILKCLNNTNLLKSIQEQFADQNTYIWIIFFELIESGFIVSKESTGEHSKNALSIVLKKVRFFKIFKFNIKKDYLVKLHHFDIRYTVISAVIGILIFITNKINFYEYIHAISSNSILNALLFLILFMAVVTIHELGHLKVCFKYKLDAPEIGMALNFGFPIFYVDTSESLLLNPKERNEISVGGIKNNIVSCCVGSILLILPWARYYVIWFFILSMTIIILNLSPFIESDGRHILMNLKELEGKKIRINYWLQLVGFSITCVLALSTWFFILKIFILGGNYVR